MVVKDGGVVRFFREKDYIMVNNDLGSGSFGKTVVIRDSFIDELFVAKKYEPIFEDQISKEKFFKSFLDEIKILFKLNHKNIVRIYNYYPFENVQTGYIIMEYIQGKRIDEYMLEDIQPFGSDDLDNLFIQLVEGFNYIEKHNIVHRDIREGNILVDENGIVKIIDFGIGKIASGDDNGQNYDSLRTEINRDGSDRLPQEYYQKEYTSKTDMFYLGELFNRLMNKINLFTEDMFSYRDILNKMMESKPEERYDNFEEIINEFSKTKFNELNVTEDDKRIYQKFSDRLSNKLSFFTEKPDFINDANIFISNLEKVLIKNLFEDYVQDNFSLIHAVVNSDFTYKTSPKEPIEDVREFLDWLKGSSRETQSLILENIISKLSTKPIDYDLAELPF
ncbi:Serine/threonine protein kinase PrkC regulator of stationary phase [Lactococcus lactis subsp. lactis]|uniref:protein kinase family protein n=1 Tax=Lactococcus lactis TaxID=1358 RepID=UPI00071D1141|nr:protein kinase family protein [Lactococcus lactis]KST78766.1 Serine/threonine protein kinase PrkC regulator of stationary phase [Lactococcus lactis subsp. lactis]